MNSNKRFTAKILSLTLIFSLSVPYQNKVCANSMIDTAIVWAPTAAAAAAFSIVSGSIYYFFPKNKKLDGPEIRILGMHFSHELIRVTTALLAGGAVGFAAHQGLGYVLADKINGIEIVRAHVTKGALYQKAYGVGISGYEGDACFFTDVVGRAQVKKKVKDCSVLKEFTEIDIAKIYQGFRDSGIDTEAKIEQFYRGIHDGFKGAFDNLQKRKESLEFSNKYGWGLLGKNVGVDTLDREIKDLEDWVRAASVTYSGAGPQSSWFIERQLGNFLRGTGTLVTAGFLMKKLEAKLSPQSPYAVKLNQMGDKLDRVSIAINMGIADKESAEKVLVNIIQQCDGRVPYSAPERQRADFLMKEAQEYLTRLEEAGGEGSGERHGVGIGDPVVKLPSRTSASA